MIRTLCTAGLFTVIMAGAASAQTPTLIAVPYTFTLRAPQTVHAGHDLWVYITPKYEGEPNLQHLYFTSVSVPYGSTYELWCSFVAPCGQDLNRKQQYQYRGVNPVRLRVRTSVTTPLGLQFVVVNTDNFGVKAELRIPFRVVLPPTPIIKEPVASVPPLPPALVSKWASTMLTLGRKWCDAKHATMAFGVETQVWYYDGARVYFQIADYTKDNTWDDCAFNIAKQYRDYILNNNGNIPSWRVFPHGLRMAYERSGDISYKAALFALATNSVLCFQGGGYNESGIRENAYALQAYIEAERAGAPRSKYLQQVADYVIAFFDILFNTDNYGLHQTFFDGLAAYALIDYYELTGDPRVPGTIKQMLDWFWLKAWTGQGLIINPEPLGPKCSWGCLQPNTDLLQLSIPAFSWYASITGDLTYLERGDQMFAHMFDSDISYSGKIFSQNYRWSYLAYRSRIGESPMRNLAAPPLH